MYSGTYMMSKKKKKKTPKTCLIVLKSFISFKRNLKQQSLQEIKTKEDTIKR